MNKLLPPTYADISRNFRLLAGDWSRGPWLMRYYMLSQFAAGLLSMACSVASVLALIGGETWTGLWLIGAAGISLGHAVGCWYVLRRRFQIRYALR